MIAALAGTGVAAYFDIFNRRTVPEWVNYGLLGVAVLLGAADFSSESFLIAGGIFILGYLLYRTGQLGGADVFVLSALALLLPRGSVGMPGIVPVFLVSGFLLLLYISILHGWRGVKATLKGEHKPSALAVAYSAASVLLLAAFLYLSSSLELPPFFLLFSALVLGCSSVLFLFREYIADSMTEWVSVRGIEEEDILAVEKLDAEIVKKYGLKKLLTKGEIERLKKIPLKKYPVYKGLPPYIPFIFIAVAVRVLFGDLFAYVMV